MDEEGMLAGAGVLVGVGSMVGVRACWGDEEGVGLVSTEEVGVECLLLWTADPGGTWHADNSQQMQIKAIMKLR
jgi:hypothetical protein